jgi:hypothetical protein
VDGSSIGISIAWRRSNRASSLCIMIMRSRQVEMSSLGLGLHNAAMEREKVRNGTVEKLRDCEVAKLRNK